MGQSLLLFIAVLAAAPICAAQNEEQALALVLASQKAVLYRAGEQLEQPLVSGEALFAGDRVETREEPVEIIRCNTNGSGHQMRLMAGTIIIQAGKDDESGATIQGRSAVKECLLPLLERRPAIATLETAESGQLETGAREAPAQPGDLLIRVARAVGLARQGSYAEAIAEYTAIAKLWPEQQWARYLTYKLHPKTTSSKGTGKLYALVLGVSKYASEPIRSLRYAHRDAELVDRFLKQSERGKTLGGQPEVLVLTDERAKYGTVRPVLNEFFSRAGSTDSILLFIAAHGIAYNQTGYVILHNSSLQSLYTTGISMDEIRNALALHAARVHRVFLFIDACHAQRIGPIRDFSKVNEQLRAAVNSVREGRIFAFFAASGEEAAFEHPRYGGGHGAFTYFLMRALNMKRENNDYARADYDSDGFLTPEEVIEYVADRVRESTRRKQRPQGETRVSDLRIPVNTEGMTLPCCNPLDRGQPAAGGVSRDPTMPAEAEDEARGVTWGSSQVMQRRIALENEIHAIISKYLEGEEVPQTRDDFARGIEACLEARKLAGGSLFLEGREEFFRGRTLIFDKNYAAAAEHLYRSIRLDPASPYAYNALGISFLEQARYNLAIAAFSDAIARAPYWAYPRHNLALTRMQLGDYAQTIANYREAIDLVPRYSYLPYNLGLVYQRMNLVEEAEAAYLQAKNKAPWRAAPSIALGVLMTERGRERRARRYFDEARRALEAAPDPMSSTLLRHNEAVLLARKASTLQQARELWRENISSRDYLPSRFALAQSFSESVNGKRAESGMLQAADAAWKDVLRQVPNHIGARLEYAGFLERTKRPEEAVRVLQDGLQISPEDVRLQEALGHIRKTR